MDAHRIGCMNLRRLNKGDIEKLAFLDELEKIKEGGLLALLAHMHKEKVPKKSLVGKMLKAGKTNPEEYFKSHHARRR